MGFKEHICFRFSFQESKLLSIYDLFLWVTEQKFKIYNATLEKTSQLENPDLLSSFIFILISFLGSY